MSFHPGGHKASVDGPDKTKNRQRFRLWLTILGAVLVFIGTLNLDQPFKPGQNWRHQPVFPTDAIALGAAFLLLPNVPFWIQRYRRKRRKS
jgi:hypothetical protein